MSLMTETRNDTPVQDSPINTKMIDVENKTTI